MQVIPSIDLTKDRARLVWWPGASTGVGTPTDRPDRIVRAFVEAGAPAIHLVDLDGPARGRPVNTAAIQAVSRAVAVPLQLAGGVDGPEQIELAFAAGATRVVLPMWVAAEGPERIAACLRVAGDWLAVGLDARPERLAEYPWRRAQTPTLRGIVEELAAAGVRRFVLGHGGSAPDVVALRELTAAVDADLVVAGGITSVDTLPALRDAGVAAVILGEVLFTGAIDLGAAIRAAA
jgi:phosphoribosylformimino-5-aminoimidazole carboxamide ribotide isomerase